MTEQEAIILHHIHAIRKDIGLLHADMAEIKMLLTHIETRIGNMTTEVANRTCVRLIYPYTVYQSDDGAWQVRFPDIPEALTEGDTEAEAHALATDALLAALDGLAKLRRKLPQPSAKGEHFVVVPMLAAP